MSSNVSWPKALRRVRARGFTLIEILVTLVILMIGLLGIAGLMAQGQRASFEAFQRQQALAFASDMAERIKSNRPGVDNTEVTETYSAELPLTAPAGQGNRYKLLADGTTKNCATTNCTTSEMVQYDAALWDGLLFGSAAETVRATGDAIGPLLTPRACVEERPGGSACPACTGPAPPPASRQVTYWVSVAWQGNTPTAKPTDGSVSACANDQYKIPLTGDDDTSDMYRRLVSVEVYTVIPCRCP